MPVLTQTGCTVNAPGALTLVLTPQRQSVVSGQPMKLLATLVAEDGPVCLAANHTFAAELTSYLPEDLEPMRTTRYVCGTAALGGLLTWPVLLPISLLDLGDGLGRYTIMRRGDRRPVHLELTLTAANQLVVRRPSDAPPPDANLWPPGEHRITIRLDNKNPPALGMFPAPLFRQAYSQPVEGTAQVDVLAR